MEEATSSDDEMYSDAEDASYDEDYAKPSFKHDDVPSTEYEDQTSSEEEDNDDGGKAIYEAVTACLEIFSRIVGQSDSSDTSAKSGEIVYENPSELAGFMKDKDRSFNLWIDYTGALAADANRSLDMRLQGYKDIKGMCVELLQMLARNLQYLEKSDRGDSSRSISSELQDAVDSIRQAVEELHFIASVIRKSSIRSHNYGLSSVFERDDETYFESYAFLIIRRTFSNARRSLCKQLSASIALRRKRMRRKIQHEEKLKTRRAPTQVITNSTRANPVTQSQPRRTQPGLSTTSLPSPRQSEYRVIPTGSIDTRSKVSVGRLRCGLKAGPALSTVSMGSSVHLPARRYPSKPQFQKGATDCACPYCARRLTTAKLTNIPTFWRDHLDEDIQPYICLSEECTSPLLFFASMSQWANHMNSVHSEQWTRRIHMSTWYCDTNHDQTEQFNDIETFIQHMKDPTNHPGRPPPSDLQLDTLSRKKQKALIRIEEYSCPFCDCVPDTLKPVTSTNEPEAIRHELQKHIASHIKSLAFLSVPVLATTETTESESNEYEDEEKRRRLRNGEEASYPSGYDEELRAVPLSEDGNMEEMPPLDVFETQNSHWHDVGFIEWYEREGAGVNISGLETDTLLQDFIRVQGDGGEDKDNSGKTIKRQEILKYAPDLIVSPKIEKLFRSRAILHDALNKSYLERENLVGRIYVAADVEDPALKGHFYIGVITQQNTIWGQYRMEKCARKQNLRFVAISDNAMKSIYRVDKLVSRELHMQRREFTCKYCSKTHRQWFQTDLSAVVSAINRWTLFTSLSSSGDDDGDELTRKVKDFTERRYDLQNFVDDFIANSGYTPKYRELVTFAYGKNLHQMAEWEELRVEHSADTLPSDIHDVDIVCGDDDKNDGMHIHRTTFSQIPEFNESKVEAFNTAGKSMDQMGGVKEEIADDSDNFFPLDQTSRVEKEIANDSEGRSDNISPPFNRILPKVSNPGDLSLYQKAQKKVAKDISINSGNTLPPYIHSGDGVSKKTEENGNSGNAIIGRERQEILKYMPDLIVSPKIEKLFRSRAILHDALNKSYLERENLVGRIYVAADVEDPALKGHFYIGVITQQNTIWGQYRMEKCARKQNLRFVAISDNAMKSIYRVDKLVSRELHMQRREFTCKYCSKTHRQWFQTDLSAVVSAINRWTLFTSLSSSGDDDGDELTRKVKDFTERRYDLQNFVNDFIADSGYTPKQMELEIFVDMHNGEDHVNNGKDLNQMKTWETATARDF